jgi:ribosomal protein S12 methylthiotransferase
VDAVIGTGELEDILAAVEGQLRLDAGAAASLPSYLYHELTPRILSTPRHAAYIKIAEGCDHPCTFCIIPQLRGKFRSRRFESVVREAESLAAAGVREVTLIGQDTTSYGEDLELRDGLPLLLERLADVEGLQWVRFLYCYPNRVTQRLLDTIAAHPRLAKYMDMPLQHASRNVLARMKRGSNGDAFLQLLHRIRTTIPSVALRTSFIVGFPGETDANFRELCDFVKAAEFDWMGVFPYSDVDNASSFSLDEKVDEETIKDRQNCLMEIQQKISARKLKRFRGVRATALVEGPSKDTPLVWEARLEGMAPEIDGKLYLNDIEVAQALLPARGADADADRQECLSYKTARPGDVVIVEISETHEYDLVGRVVEILDVPQPAAAHSAVTGPVQRVSTGAVLRVLA